MNRRKNYLFLPVILSIVTFFVDKLLEIIFINSISRPKPDFLFFHVQGKRWCFVQAEDKY